MSSLAKRFLVVVIAGLGAIGVATYVGRKNDTARFDAARTRIDAECRAFRGLPRNHHSSVCRPYDQYEPKALPRMAQAKRHFEEARSKAAHGDHRGAEALLRAALAPVDELQHMGSLIADLVATSIVKGALEVLANHPALDARGVLAGVRLDVSRPFEEMRLHHEWLLVHWNDSPGPQESRSTRALAEAIEETESATLAMHERILRGDVAACDAQSRAAHLDPELAPDLCAKVDEIIQTAAHLDAARR